MVNPRAFPRLLGTRPASEKGKSEALLYTKHRQSTCHYDGEEELRRMGPLAEWEARRDILSLLDEMGLEVLVDRVMGGLTSQDLRQCRLVSWSWLSLVSRVTRHRQQLQHQHDDHHTVMDGDDVDEDDKDDDVDGEQ